MYINFMANVQRTDDIMNYDTLEWTWIDLDYERKLQGRSQLFIFWDLALQGNPGNLVIFF